MPDKAVISHRGEKYEIGRGKRFYGIWAIGAPYEAPVDRWPENPDGWQQAWARFASIEVPGTIAAVTRQRKGMLLSLGRRNVAAGAASDTNPVGSASSAGGTARPRSRAAGRLLVGEALLVLGVVLGLGGLFPAYEGGQSLLSQGYQVVVHLCYVIGWAVTAALVALSVARPSNAARLGALFGLGLSAVTFGLFLADVGQLTGGGSATFGSGLVVSLLGWLACTTGSALALSASPSAAGPGQPPSRPVRPGSGHVGPVALLVLAAIGTAAAFVPSWDSYVLVAKATGATQTITAGNAFDNPGWVIAGNVCVMAAIIGVAALAALWRPARHGALLLAGAIVPLAAQFVSALMQASQPPSPTLFGISGPEAAALGLTISPGLTGIFWVYFVFVISLLVSCAWLATEPGHTVMPGFPVSPWRAAEEAPGTQDASGVAVSEDADSDASDGTDSDGTDSPTATGDTATGTGDGEQSTYA